MGGLFAGKGSGGALGGIEAGALHGVDIRQRGTDDHGVGDASAEEVDAFGEAAAEDESNDIGKGEGLLDPGGLGCEVGKAGLEGDAEVGGGAVELAGEAFSVGVAGEKDGDGTAGGGVEGGDGGGRGGSVAVALAVASIDPGVVGDVVGADAPGGVGDEEMKFAGVEADGGGVGFEGGEGGAGEDCAAESAEDRGGDGGGVEAGEVEFAGAGAPDEAGERMIGKPSREIGDAPEVVGEVGAEGGEVEVGVEELLGEASEDVGQVVFEDKVDSVGGGG